jgi:hypothetical protein
MDGDQTALPGRAQHATGTAAARAGDVAQTAKEEVRHARDEATHQTRRVLDQLQSDVRTRADGEAQRVASTLHDTSEQLRSMADATGGQGFAAALAQEGARATERLASRIDQGGLDAVLADVRSWARRNPGTFLAGAAAAGFVLGRIVRHAAPPESHARAAPVGSEAPVAPPPPAAEPAYASSFPGDGDTAPGRYGGIAS